MSTKNIETMEMPPANAPYPRTEADVAAEAASEKAWELPSTTTQVHIDGPDVGHAEQIPVDHQLAEHSQA